MFARAYLGSSIESRGDLGLYRLSQRRTRAAPKRKRTDAVGVVGCRCCAEEWIFRVPGSRNIQAGGGGVGSWPVAQLGQVARPLGT